MKKHFFELCDKLVQNHRLELDEYEALIESYNCDCAEYIFKAARCVRDEVYGRQVFLRGLVEVSSYCKNDCLYCGLRCSNKNAQRYRLNKTQILDCCKQGYAANLRTFVLQGGEDTHLDDDFICDVVFNIKKLYPDCAVTLSLGEKSYESLKQLYDCGADRYLLRHETAENEHYSKLHPKEMSLGTRMKCLENLRKIGYQTGCGFMVGSPYQTTKNLALDLSFIEKFKPHMVGIGPFIPHKDTPFAQYKAGSADLTLLMLSIVRLINPNVLLPATTALSTVDESGHILGLNAGANVIMPNLSPIEQRKKYSIYDGKKITDMQACENVAVLKAQLEKHGYTTSAARGDSKVK